MESNDYTIPMLKEGPCPERSLLSAIGLPCRQCRSKYLIIGTEETSLLRALPPNHHIYAKIMSICLFN